MFATDKEYLYTSYTYRLQNGKGSVQNVTSSLRHASH